jgi:hypothetical protein
LPWLFHPIASGRATASTRKHGVEFGVTGQVVAAGSRGCAGIDSQNIKVEPDEETIVTRSQRTKSFDSEDV